MAERPDSGVRLHNAFGRAHGLRDRRGTDQVPCRQHHCSGTGRRTGAGRSPAGRRACTGTQSHGGAATRGGQRPVVPTLLLGPCLSSGGRALGKGIGQGTGPTLSARPGATNAARDNAGRTNWEIWRNTYGHRRHRREADIPGSGYRRGRHPRIRAGQHTSNPPVRRPGSRSALVHRRRTLREWTRRKCKPGTKTHSPVRGFARPWPQISVGKTFGKRPCVKSAWVLASGESRQGPKSPRYRTSRPRASERASCR